MNNLINILLLAFLGSALGLIGGIIVLLVKKWRNILTEYSIPFAAGILLTISLLGLLPEAVDLVGEKAFLITLMTFVGSYLFETWFCELHHHDDNHHVGKESVALVIVGDTIHNFIDGVAIAASYLADPGLGLVTAFSTFLHEIPHEIGDFGILLKANWKSGKVFLVNFLSALSTVVGALVVFFWINQDSFSGYLLAVSAGMFLYLGASDFLPKANEKIDKVKALLILLMGIVIMFTTLALVPHSHDEDANPTSESVQK